MIDALKHTLLYPLPTSAHVII